MNSELYENSNTRIQYKNINRDRDIKNNFKLRNTF